MCLCGFFIERKPGKTLREVNSILYANSYLVPGTSYNLFSQSRHVFLLDVGDLILPLDLVPNVFGRFDNDAVSGLN